MKKHAQAALEFLLLIAFATLLLFPVMFLFFHFINSSSGTIVDSQANQLGNFIVTKAETSYSYGEHAKEVVLVTFPKNIEAMYIEQINGTSALVFNISSNQGTRSLVFFSQVTLTGTFDPEEYAEGTRKLVVETLEGGNEVLVNVLGASEQ